MSMTCVLLTIGTFHDMRKKSSYYCVRLLRAVPWQMLWELRAEPLPGNPEGVLIEMRQVPGYLDFLAEIMPPDVRCTTFR